MFRIRWGNSVLTREAPGDVQCLSDVWVNERKPRERGGGILVEPASARVLL